MPTYVELTSFTAEGGEDHVDVTWTTAMEIDNAGFNLHRSTVEDGKRLLLTSELIAATGSEFKGATYSFTDTDVTQGVTYYYWLEDVDLDGHATLHGPATAALASVESKPSVFSLAQNHPNPFRERTEIRYGLPMDCKVSLTIYNLAGQKVRTLVDETQGTGHRVAYWDGTNDLGVNVSDGIYFYRLKAAGYTEIRKMMLFR